MGHLEITFALLSIACLTQGSGYHPSIGGPWARYSTTVPPPVGSSDSVHLPPPSTTQTPDVPPPAVTFFPKPNADFTGSNSNAGITTNNLNGNENALRANTGNNNPINNDNERYYIVKDPVTGEGFFVNQQAFWERFGNMLTQNDAGNNRKDYYTYNVENTPHRRPQRDVIQNQNRQNDDGNQLKNSFSWESASDELSEEFIPYPQKKIILLRKGRDLFSSEEGSSYEEFHKNKRIIVQIGGQPRPQQTADETFRKFFPNVGHHPQNKNPRMTYKYVHVCLACGLELETTSTTSTTTMASTTTPTTVTSSEVPVSSSSSSQEPELTTVGEEIETTTIVPDYATESGNQFVPPSK